jgi:hypothetical protein
MTDSPPIPLFKAAILAASPYARIRSSRKGAKSTFMPMPLNERQRIRQGIRWIIETADKRPQRSIDRRLATECLSILAGDSPVLKKLDERHKQAMVSRYVHWVLSGVSQVAQWNEGDLAVMLSWRDSFRTSPEERAGKERRELSAIPGPCSSSLLTLLSSQPFQERTSESARTDDGEGHLGWPVQRYMVFLHSSPRTPRLPRLIPAAVSRASMALCTLHSHTVLEFSRKCSGARWRFV